MKPNASHPGEAKQEKTMRNMIPLTDEEIEAKFDDCCTVDDLSFTRDTLADFHAAREHYNIAGRLVRDADGVYEIDGAQAAKGQPRRNIKVVDFGEVRAFIEL